MAEKSMSRASVTMDESGAAVYERNNDVIVVPPGLASTCPIGDQILVSDPMPDEAWEKLRAIVKAYREENA